MGRIKTGLKETAADARLAARLAAFRRKAAAARRRDFLREAAKAARLTPEERLETALDLIDSLMELKEAAGHAEDA